MEKRRVVSIVLAVVLSIGLLVFGCAKPAPSPGPTPEPEKKVVNVGDIFCMTGPWGDVGLIGGWGLRAGVEYANDNELVGKGIELKMIQRDDRLDPTTTASEYQKIKNDVVMLSVSHSVGNTALLDLVGEDKVPMVCTTTNSLL